MVGAMLRGNMSFNRVAENLLAQRPRLHEQELREGSKGPGLS